MSVDTLQKIPRFDRYSIRQPEGSSRQLLSYPESVVHINELMRAGLLSHGRAVFLIEYLHYGGVVNFARPGETPLIGNDYNYLKIRNFNTNGVCALADDFVSELQQRREQIDLFISPENSGVAIGQMMQARTGIKSVPIHKNNGVIPEDSYIAVLPSYTRPGKDDRMSISKGLLREMLIGTSGQIAATEDIVDTLTMARLLKHFVNEAARYEHPGARLALVISLFLKKYTGAVEQAERENIALLPGIEVDDLGVVGPSGEPLNWIRISQAPDYGLSFVRPNVHR